jgi:hypothetical protein
MTEFGGPSWSLSLIEDWEAEHDAECDSIYNPNGVGALQISTLKKQTVVTDQDLKALASQHSESDVKINQVFSGDFSGITFSLVIDDDYWRYWYLRSGFVVLFVTYNCNLEDKAVEEKQVNLILNSLKAAA